LLLVDKTETEKNVLNSEISMLTQKIVDQQVLINQQNEDNVSCIFSKIKYLLHLMNYSLLIITSAVHLK